MIHVLQALGHGTGAEVSKADQLPAPAVDAAPGVKAESTMAPNASAAAACQYEHLIHQQNMRKHPEEYFLLISDELKAAYQVRSLLCVREMTPLPCHVRSSAEHAQAERGVLAAHQRQHHD